MANTHSRFFTAAEYYDESRFDWADADRAYQNYLDNCRRLGVAPMSWEQAKAQMEQWSDALSAGRWVPPANN